MPWHIENNNKSIRLGKIAIGLAIYTLVIVPSVWFGDWRLPKYSEFLFALTPLYAIVIIIFGHLSIRAKDGYGKWLYMSMGFGYLIIGVIIMRVLYFIIHFDLGGIR